MNCDETDVFDACVSWARVKCEQEGIDATNTENLRAALDGALFKIRVCSMNNRQFARITRININHMGLLTVHESIDVFRTIGIKANGRISTIFGELNGKSREPVELSLECSFSKGQPIRMAWDCSSFSCDKAINLCGFVICNKVDEDIEVSVGLRRIYQKIPYTKLLLENETKIIFDNPLRITQPEQ